MIVNPPKKGGQLKPLLVNNNEVPFVNQLKYLGVTIDSKLSWKPHIQERISKAKRDLLIARKLVNKEWGLAPARLLWVYEAVVRPAVDYACHVWTPDKCPVWLEKALDRVQRLALITTTSCIKSTPTRALERLTNVPPLYLHLKKKAAITVNRIHDVVNKSGWDGLANGIGKSHLFRWKKYLGIPPQKDIFKLNLETYEVDFTNSPPPGEGWCIYTDGSKMNENVGLGWVITLGDEMLSYGYKNLPTHASVYEAEVLAVQCATEDLIQNIIPKATVDIKTITYLVDNQATLYTINKTKLVGQLRVDLINCLNNLKYTHKITPKFKWVKSHVGIVGNELADEMAKLGTLSNDRIEVPQSITFVKNKLKQMMYKQWENKWANLTDCRQSKQLITFNPNHNERNYLLTRTRTKCRKLVALLTGHNNLRYHTFKRNVSSNPNYSPCCRYCREQIETSWHLLYECPSLDTRRREFEFSPENPKKGPDIARYNDRATHLGILDILLEKSEMDID